MARWLDRPLPGGAAAIMGAVQGLLLLPDLLISREEDAVATYLALGHYSLHWPRSAGRCTSR